LNLESFSVLEELHHFS